MNAINKIYTFFLLALLVASSQVINAVVIEENDTTEVKLSFEDETLIDLFMSNVRQGEFEWALEIYDKIEYREIPELQHAYLRALERTGQNEGMLEKYQELSRNFPDYQPAYETALFYVARRDFEIAERKFQYEMAKYRQDENATTYALLRRELRRLSEDFRNVRDKVLELREINPSDKRYITLLRNCYYRLNEDAEAEKLNRLLEN